MEQAARLSSLSIFGRPSSMIEVCNHYHFFMSMQGEVRNTVRPSTFRSCDSRPFKRKRTDFPPSQPKRLKPLARSAQQARRRRDRVIKVAHATTALSSANSVPATSHGAAVDSHRRIRMPPRLRVVPGYPVKCWPYFHTNTVFWIVQIASWACALSQMAWP